MGNLVRPPNMDHRPTRPPKPVALQHRNLRLPVARCRLPHHPRRSARHHQKLAPRHRRTLLVFDSRRIRHRLHRRPRMVEPRRPQRRIPASARRTGHRLGRRRRHRQPRRTPGQPHRPPALPWLSHHWPGPHVGHHPNNPRLIRRPLGATRQRLHQHHPHPHRHPRTRRNPHLRPNPTRALDRRPPVAARRRSNA